MPINLRPLKQADNYYGSQKSVNSNTSAKMQITIADVKTSKIKVV